MQHGGISPVLRSQRSGMPDQKSGIFRIFAFIHFCRKLHLSGIALFQLRRRGFRSRPCFCRQSPLLIPHPDPASGYKITGYDTFGNSLRLSANIYTASEWAAVRRILSP